MEEGDNRKLFAGLGLKYTYHRDMIYEILKGAELPLSAEDIYLKLKTVDASVSFSTVYRTLDCFAQKGIAVRSSEGSDNRTVYELTRGEHRHRLVCIGCKRVVPLEDCPLDDYARSLAQKTQFDITTHRLEIFGYCPNCKGRET